MPDTDPQLALSLLATREDIRAGGERLRQHMTIVMERQRRKIQALIDLLATQSAPSDS